MEERIGDTIFLLLGKKREAAFRCSFNPAEIFSALIFVPKDSGGIIRSHKEVFVKNTE